MVFDFLTTKLEKSYLWYYYNWR